MHGGEDVHIYILNFLIDILEIIIFITGAYYLAVAFFSLFGKNRYGAGDEYTFAVLIPAHNEEKTIGGLISSIKNTDYPQNKIDIFVISDECSDNTAEIARNCGVNVIERCKSTNKGDALKEGISFVEDMGYDCVAVFDADNVVDKDFFTYIAEYISSGASVVQGYVDSKNPDASWVSNAYSIWYWITNRLFQAGRGKLSLGCRINGTGFVIKSDVLDKVKWNTKTSAEDSEYTAILALNGIKVDFCERAVVFDEKPERFSDSAIQRRRWAQGICDVQGEYTLKLIKNFKINALLCLWGDLIFVLCPVLLFLSYVFGIGRIWHTTFGFITLVIYFLLNIIVSGLALIKDKKLNFKVFANFFGFILFMISWIPVGITGIFGKRGKWMHTKHN